MKTRWGRLAFGVEDEEYTLVELMVLNDESSLNLWTVGNTKMFSCWENSNSALRKRSPGWQTYRVHDTYNNEEFGRSLMASAQLLSSQRVFTEQLESSSELVLLPATHLLISSISEGMPSRTR